MSMHGICRLGLTSECAQLYLHPSMQLLLVRLPVYS